MTGDLESNELDELTVQGGWHLLCVQLLHDATMRIKESRNLFRRSRGVEACADRRGGIAARDDWESAERWIQGGVGLITFEDCCDLLNVNPEVAREKIGDHAYQSRRDRPRNVPW